MDKLKIRTWAEIDLNALVHNFKIAQTRSEKVMCVIKGDAHGHGAVACAHVLEKAGAYAFAVACLSEAIALREAGIDLPILILGWTAPECAKKLIAYNLMQSILSEEYAVQLNAVAQEAGGGIKVHVKLDTGMSRTGIYAQENQELAAAAICRIETLENLQIEGIFTHFASADQFSANEFTMWQIENYQKVLKQLEISGFSRNVIHHASNSAGILMHPEAHFEMVRAGVMLYGLSPTNHWNESFSLEPVLTLKSRVVQVKSLPAGSHISYGCTYRAEQPMEIAVVAAGYADSYPRSLSNMGAYAVINGERCRQVGRICMDMCMFEVTGKSVQVGDEVILYGRGGMSLEEVSNSINTINCELTCLLTKRVPRVYVNSENS